MSALAALLERETTEVSRFIALLEQEQELLKNGDANQLPPLTAEKSALVETLNTLEAQRLAVIGNPGTAQGSMETWLAEHPEEQAATVNWKKLLKLASDAKALHQVNSRLVELHLQQTNEVLSILTQRQEHETIYGASGQSLTASGSRIVDSA